MINAIIFDIDGTLTPEISWVALTRDLGASVETHDAIFKRFLSGDITYEDSKKQLIDMWAKTGNANETYINNIFQQWKLYPQAETLIKYLDAHEIITTLITGSFDLYANVIASRLGVKFYYANTKLIWDQNGNLIDFDYVQNQSEEKVKHFKSFCDMLSLPYDKCIAIGDDDNDIGLFKITRRGISVKSVTSHKLDSIAWKKVDNLAQVMEIIRTQI